MGKKEADVWEHSSTDWSELPKGVIRLVEDVVRYSKLGQFVRGRMGKGAVKKEEVINNKEQEENVQMRA